MKIVPILRCRDMAEAVAFYTDVLGFEMWPGDTVECTHVDMLLGDAQIQLSSSEGVPGVAVNVEVDEIDELFKRFVERGLSVPNDPDSPVHNGPIDQTWGFREFYVNDPSGNTLRFRKWITT